MAYQHIITFSYSINSSTASGNKKEIYKCGVSPGKNLTNLISASDFFISGSIEGLNIKCFFPTAEKEITTNNQTYYYANILLRIWLKVGNQPEIPWFEFQPYSSSRRYYFDILERFSSAENIILSQDDSISVSIEDLGTGRLKSNEYIYLLGESVETWGNFGEI